VLFKAKEPFRKRAWFDSSSFSWKCSTFADRTEGSSNPAKHSFTKQSFVGSTNLKGFFQSFAFSGPSGVRKEKTCKKQSFGEANFSFLRKKNHF